MPHQCIRRRPFQQSAESDLPFCPLLYSVNTVVKHVKRRVYPIRRSGLVRCTTSDPRPRPAGQCGSLNTDLPDDFDRRNRATDSSPQTVRKRQIPVIGSLSSGHRSNSIRV